MPNQNNQVKIIVVCVFGALLVFGSCAIAYPHYGVYSQRKTGEAELARAQSAKLIQIEGAKADLDAAGYEEQARTLRAVGEANAEIERARGVSEAIKIIGGKLRDYPEYRNYRFVEGLGDNCEVIYVPTEANIPVLEISRRMLGATVGKK